ncbi:MAG: lytic transglycosylase domain-containing protein [Campylobacteraceae bacterium]|nr:lytic transglycosylase domain-containing protein [Campylobacteraceae bacterium]
MKNIFIVFFALISSVSAYTITQINTLEKSLAKDFVIYEYLQNHTPSKKEAIELKKQIHTNTYRLNKLFNTFIKDEEFTRKLMCANLKTKELFNVSKECLKLALTPAKAQELNLKEKKALYKRQASNWLKAMIAKDTFSFLTKSDPDDFIKVFMGVSEKYKQKVLNKKLPIKFLNSLKNAKKFEDFILHVSIQGEYKNISNSLMNLHVKNANISFKSSFYLGILALKLNKDKKAYEFFQEAYFQSKNQAQTNQALFWQYQTSKDKQYLQELANSKYFGFYSLYAKEILHVDLKIYTPKPSKQNLEYYSHTDPFSWEYTKKYLATLSKDELKTMAKKFFTKQTLPFHVYISQKAYGYDRVYFITPYEEYIKHLSDSKKILIYAIARQESRLIPVDVSRSYALGMMQFMPFLAKHTAKKKNLNSFTYFDMFKPKISLEFASDHLEYLEKFLYHPLFVAYAYNGGIGFTRIMLQEKKLFQKGKYEPFLSLELVPYEESRDYGKKVLANYTIYSRIYDQNITLTNLLRSLTSNSHPLFR